MSEQFERDKVSYEQNFEQFRSMNQIMWQVPLLAITITGGLWYVAFDLAPADSHKNSFFVLSIVFNIALIVVLCRIRYVMGQYLAKLKSFNPDSYVEAPGTNFLNRTKTVFGAFSIALFAASLIAGYVIYVDLSGE